MKKILCGILAVAMAFSCAACSGSNYSDYDTAVLELESVSAKAGSEIDVEVYLGNNPGTACVDVELEYDSSVFTAVGAKVAGDLKGNGLFSSNVTEDEYEMVADGGNLHAMWFNGFNTDATGEVMVLTFEVAEDAPAGEYTISFVQGEDDLVSVVETGSGVDDVDYVNLDVTYIDGVITVS